MELLILAGLVVIAVLNLYTFWHTRTTRKLLESLCEEDKPMYQDENHSKMFDSLRGLTATRGHYFE